MSGKIISVALVQQVKTLIIIALCIIISFLSSYAYSRDLAEIEATGVLRHLGVPYANFVTEYKEGNQIIHSGFDVELIQGFAKYLGVKYQFVSATWKNVFGKLTGKDVQFIDKKLTYGSPQPIEGDLIANGLTTLDWRKNVVHFSLDYFPSAVWLIARMRSNILPIKPSGSIEEDINHVKEVIANRSVLAMKYSCLDPNLYQLNQTQANVVLPKKSLKLNEMVPAILNNEAEATILDLADSLIALEKWSNEIKVIGPISEDQTMAVGFRKSSPQLRQAFNQYLVKIKKNGVYMKLVDKYYPSIRHYYNDYFINNNYA